MTIEEQLILHEGLRLKAYKDLTGHLTIGVGRNLDAVGISREEAMLLLKNDLLQVRGELASKLPSWEQLNPYRKRALIDMAFNLGVGGLLKFKKMLVAVERGNYEQVSIEILNSKWALQVGKRAQRLALMMRTGSPIKV